MNSTPHLTELLGLINGVIWEADPDTLNNTFISPQVQRILGYTPEQWVSEPGFWEARVHPDDRARAAAQTKSSLDFGQPFEIEYRFRTGDGRTVWLRDHVTPLYDQGRRVKLGGIMIDVTQQKTAELTLGAARDRFEKVFAATPVGITLTGLHSGRVVESNDAFLRILGVSRAALIGSTNQHLNPWVDLADRERLVRQMEDAGSVREFDSTFWHFPSGERRQVTLFAERLDFEGEELIVLITQDVTARRQAEAAREASEGRFRALVQQSTDIVTVVDHLGDLTYASPSLHTILGHETPDVLGRSVLSFMHRSEHPEIRVAFDETISGGLGTTRTRTHRFRRIDGRYRWLEWAATNRLDDPHVRGVVINSRDVTERVESELALAESRTTFQVLFEHSPDAILLVDFEGDMPIRACNPVAARMNGYTQAELVGQSTYLTLPEDEAARLIGDVSANDPFRERLRRERHLHMETRHRRKDGSLYPLEVHLALVELGGREMMLSIERDITERKEAEAALGASQARLLSAEKLASLGRLTAGLAHEINTPLAAVMNSLHEARGFASEYRDSIGVASVTPEDHQAIAGDLLRSLDDGDRAATRIGEFIRNMRGHTRDQASGMRDFDARRLAGDTLSMLGHEARRAGIDLLMEQARGPVPVHGEPGRFTQVVTNLVINAVHACEESGRAKGSVSLSLRREDDWTVMRVRDTGTGIAPHVLTRIFDPLFTTKDIGKGTGLGLSIIYDIVTGHFGGEISVETELGIGTTFSVRFPVVATS